MKRRQPPINGRPRRTQTGATRFMSVVDSQRLPQGCLKTIKRLLKKLGFKKNTF